MLLPFTCSCTWLIAKWTEKGRSHKEVKPSCWVYKDKGVFFYPKLGVVAEQVERNVAPKNDWFR